MCLTRKGPWQVLSEMLEKYQKAHSTKCKCEFAERAFYSCTYFPKRKFRSETEYRIFVMYGINFLLFVQSFPLGEFCDAAV